MPATIGLICLVPLSAALAYSPGAPQPVQPAASPPAAPSEAAVPGADGQSAAGEAARHAQRTACIKEARAKRLVGAARNSYIKECIAKR